VGSGFFVRGGAAAGGGVWGSGGCVRGCGWGVWGGGGRCGTASRHWRPSPLCFIRVLTAFFLARLNFLPFRNLEPGIRLPSFYGVFAPFSFPFRNFAGRSPACPSFLLSLPV